MRRFFMDRPTGESFVGADGSLKPKTACVAAGCVFHDGATVLRWLGKVASMAIYPSLADFKAIHVEGHVGTELRWWDKVCFQCGTVCDRSVSPTFKQEPGACLYCGASWDEPADEIEPNGGHWILAATLEPSK